MIPVIIFIALMLIAVAFVIFAFSRSTDTDDDLDGTILKTVTICLALFIAATIIGYCATVMAANGTYEILTIGNESVNTTVSTNVQKYTAKDGFVTSVIISPSLAQLLGFLSTCCYVYTVVRIYIGYQQIMRKKNENMESDPFA